MVPDAGGVIPASDRGTVGGGGRRARSILPQHPVRFQPQLQPRHAVGGHGGDCERVDLARLALPPVGGHGAIRLTNPVIVSVFADEANALMTRLFCSTRPGHTSTKPDSPGMPTSIVSSGDVVPPYSMVSLVVAGSVLTHQSHTSSMFVVPDPAVWIVVPGVAVAATFIGRPLVEPLNNCFEYVVMKIPAILK